MRDNAIILFFRYPEKGKVKTRLAAEVGDELAFELYNCFLLDSIETLAQISADLIILGTGNPGTFIAELPNNIPYLPQRGDDLGARMYNAFCDVFARGYKGAVLIGGDIPGLRPEVVSRALHELACNDVILGPSADGGYYLIGFRQDTLKATPFEDIRWSTPLVLAETVKKINKMGMDPYFLTETEDIDDLKALARFYEKQRRAQTPSHTIECLKAHRESIYGKIRL